MKLFFKVLIMPLSFIFKIIFVIIKTGLQKVFNIIIALAILAGLFYFLQDTIADYLRSIWENISFF